MIYFDVFIKTCACVVFVRFYWTIISSKWVRYKCHPFSLQWSMSEIVQQKRKIIFNRWMNLWWKNVCVIHTDIHNTTIVTIITVAVATTTNRPTDQLIDPTNRDIGLGTRRDLITMKFDGNHHKTSNFNHLIKIQTACT